ncbi:hypothetical protein FISHEDRAFT_73673 [Fistulina hepatica ATCC 64428]|uniref:DUF6534 domain-containing protein n=1 Tax=Fistulina hepatica ATCC 64428 TaxID=1128425 RepID=A0A0D7ABV7_9AGAR|nr:hypothetical protein FISHEDRAFT_73673 [Fistulina hepatica ATCC 64428]
MSDYSGYDGNSSSSSYSSYSSASYSLDDTMGVIFISNVLTAVLWGAACVQTYIYTITYWNRDSWKLKSLVYSIFALDTLHQALLSMAVYKYLITHFGDYDYLDAPAKDIFEALNVAYFSVILYWVIRGLLASTWAELDRSPMHQMIVALNAFGFANDVVITIAFTFFLHRSKNGLSRTTRMVNRIVIMSINTGSITAAFGLGALIAWLVVPTAQIYSALWLVGGRLYSNSMLGILNARNFVREAGDNTDAGIEDFPSFSAATDTTGIPTETDVGSQRSKVDFTSRRVHLGVTYQPSIELQDVKSTSRDLENGLVTRRT